MDKTKLRTPQELIKEIRSGVIHIEFLIKNDVIASGSGFLSQGYLITNNHVYSGSSNAESVRLAWHSEAISQSIEEITISIIKFKTYLKAGSDEDNYDYAILDVPELNDKNLYNFSLASHNENNIFDEILILGFPFEHQNLVCHRGVISSFFSKNGVDIIQLDASVNSSNSGGPLINLKTYNVIGVVTRKNTGLSKTFKELYKNFDKQIEILSASLSEMWLGKNNLDPIHALVTGQEQMKNLAKEIERSANVGIGYAFSIKHVLEEIEGLKN
jgi:hypothetical protein